MFIKVLLEQESVPTYVLQSVGGVSSKDEFSHLTHILYKSGLIQSTKNGSFSSTRRLKLAIAALKNKKVENKVDTDKPRSFSDKNKSTITVNGAEQFLQISEGDCMLFYDIEAFPHYWGCCSC
jgi:hypothetical protein